MSRVNGTVDKEVDMFELLVSIPLYLTSQLFSLISVLEAI